MAAPNPLFLRDQELDRALELLVVALRRIEAETALIRDEADIDTTDQWLLFMIEHKPGATAADLAQRLALTKQTLSRHVRRLVALDLVATSGDSGDGRKRPLRLSERGRQLAGALANGQKRPLRQAFKLTGAVPVEGFQAVLGELAGEQRRRAGIASRVLAS